MTTTTPAWFDRSAVAPASLIDEIEKLTEELMQLTPEHGELPRRIRAVLIEADKVERAALEGVDKEERDGLGQFIYRVIGAKDLFDMANSIGNDFTDAADHRPEDASS